MRGREREPATLTLRLMRLSSLLVFLTTTACVAGNTIALSTQNTSRPAGRETFSLGVQNVDAVNSFGASIVLADSVLRDLGWSMASVNRDRSAMATQWLYIEGPTFDPTRVHRCGAGSDVGLRLVLAPTKQDDSSRYSIRGEMQLAETAPLEDERIARDGFALAVARLRTALATPLANSDTLRARLRAISGEARVASTRRWSVCSSIEHERSSP